MSKKSPAPFEYVPFVLRVCAFMSLTYYMIRRDMWWAVLTLIALWIFRDIANCLKEIADHLKED